MIKYIKNNKIIKYIKNHNNKVTNHNHHSFSNNKIII